MPRPALLLACVLLAATGLALVGLAQTATMPVRSGKFSAEIDNIAITRTFYAAANEVLATGDTAALDAVLAPGYAGHLGQSGDGGRAALEQALVSRHLMFAGLRLLVDDVDAAGADRVAVRVHADVPTTGSFLGRPVEWRLAEWGPVELLRIADGRVAEQWSGATNGILPLPLWEAELPPEDAPALHVVALRRFRWDRDAVLRALDNPATWFLLVEEGTLRVTAEDGPPVTVRRPTNAIGDHEPAIAIDAGRSADADPGTLVVVPSLTRFSVTNAGTDRAAALLVALWAPPPVNTANEYAQWVIGDRASALALAPETAGTISLTPGVSADVLTTVGDVVVPRSARLAVGTVTMAAETSLFLPGADSFLILAVEAGSLAVEASGQPLWVFGGNGRPPGYLPGATLTDGDGAAVATGSASVWRSGEAPVVVLVVTIDSPVFGHES